MTGMRPQHLALLSVALACCWAVQVMAVPFPAGKQLQKHPADPNLQKHPADPKLQKHPADPHPVHSDPPVQHTDEAFFDQCTDGLDQNWIKYKSSCYRYYETIQYWYLAELDCRRLGGHLVSIADKSENSFVAKLTYCQSAWTGRYAVSVDHLTNPSNYQWTDASSSGQYHAHNFSTINSIHDPLISVSNLQWNNNVYHSRHKYVCEVPVGNRNATRRCPDGWKQLNGNCYLMPDFSTTFIEANFFCSGKGAHLVSVHSSQELRALSLLDLDSPGCPPVTWVGLIKINPCRMDFSTGNIICYKWSDRSTDFYRGFPAWHPGHPDIGEQVNCVIVEDRAMKTVQCYERHRFICKKPASA